MVKELQVNLKVPKKTKLLILGAGGQGKVCSDIANCMGKWEFIGFLDNNKATIDEKILGFPVLDTITNFEHYLEDYAFFIGIGCIQARKTIAARLIKKKAVIATLIHPEAYLATGVQVGKGSVVMPRGIINVAAIIGDFTIINTASVIEHDCQIGNFVNIAPNVAIAGNVVIEDDCSIGIGATIVQNLKIGNKVIIGAQSVVLETINEAGTYVGIPVRKLNASD